MIAIDLKVIWGISAKRIAEAVADTPLVQTALARGRFHLLENKASATVT